MKKLIVVVVILAAMFAMLALSGCGPKVPQDIGTPDQQVIEKDLIKFICSHYTKGYKLSNFKVTSYSVGQQVERLDESNIKQQVKPIAVTASMIAEIKSVENGFSMKHVIHRKIEITAKREYFFYIDRQGAPTVEANKNNVVYNERNIINQDDLWLAGQLMPHPKPPQ